MTESTMEIRRHTHHCGFGIEAAVDHEAWLKMRRTELQLAIGHAGADAPAEWFREIRWIDDQLDCGLYEPTAGGAGLIGVAIVAGLGFLFGFVLAYEVFNA